MSAWSEAGLDGAVLVLPGMLAMVPHGAAPLAAFAGLCAVGVVAANRPYPFAALRPPTAILGALLLWGFASALWSITPGRSLVLELRLAGLLATGLALAAAALRLAMPRRLVVCALLGTGIGIALALIDFTTAGGLSQFVSVRPFGRPRLNQLAVWVALLWLPATAFVAGRSRAAALTAAAAMAGTVFVLAGTAAKVALALGLSVAALAYFRRRSVCRVAAALSVLVVLTAPLTLPRLDRLPGLFAVADLFKESAGHRLLIWSFVGDRIAERPFAGWGLDTSRAIPGGKDEIRPGQNWLPLHTHDAALQVWLELGAPGAALFALFIGWLWLRLGEAQWPPVYAAAAVGSFAAAIAVLFAGWGIWEEWWLATLALLLLIAAAMARAAEEPR